MTTKKALRKSLVKKRIFIGVLSFLVIALTLALGIEESRTFIIGFFLRLFFFVKKNIIKFLVTFFLVKGKFVLMLFVKKLALLSVTGLGKRYMIEKVIMGNMKVHFFDHIAKDIKKFFLHIKKNFANFPLGKKVIALFAFLGSLGFVGKFMGGMLAFKVFLAKLWSFLLAIFLKVGGSVLYFFTDYLWGSWLQPLLEILIFSWLFALLEKIPFLEKWIKKMYAFFLEIFEIIEEYLDVIIHKPLKRFLQWLVKKIQKFIYKFIGYKRVSAHKRVLQVREAHLNLRAKFLQKRKEKQEEKQEEKTGGIYYVPARKRLLQKRKEKKRTFKVEEFRKMK